MDRTAAEENARSKSLGLNQGSRGRRGRKDSTGDEQVLKAQPIKEALSELMVAYQKFELAKKAYNDLRKLVAERSNADSSDLAKLLKASAKGKFEDVQRRLQQQVDLFEVIGEVAQGTPTQ